MTTSSSAGERIVGAARLGLTLSSDRAHVVLWMLVGGICCALVGPFEPNLLEEGVGLHVAQRLAHGEQLYRDVLVYTGPLPFELLGLLFRAFGEEIWVARSFVVGLHALATGAAFALARGARRGLVAHAAAAATGSAPILLFPLFGIYYYTTIAFHLSLLAGWAAFRGTHATRWAVLAGVLVAAVALCKQTIGVSLAVALAVGLFFAARRRLRPLVAFAVGGVAAALAATAVWAARGVLDDVVYGLVFLPASLDQTYNSPFINLWPPGELTLPEPASPLFYLPFFYTLTQGIFAKPTPAMMFATQLLFALPLLAVVATAARLIWSPTSPAFLLHSALLVAWLSNLFPRTDWGHLVHVLPLGLAQFCLALPEPARPSPWRWLTAQLPAALVIVSLAAGSGLAWWTIDGLADAGPLSERVSLRPVSATLRGGQVRSVIGFLERHTRRGEFIFVARAEPLVYFATDTRNPTPYPGVLPAIREEQQRTILAALRSVRYVVMSDIDQPAMHYYSEVFPEVQAHLERFFHPPSDFPHRELQWLGILERGFDRGATAIDLVELAASGRPFIRDREGEIEPAPHLTERFPTRRNRRILGFPLGATGGGIDFDVDVPEGAVFQADASLGRVFGAEGIFGVPWPSRLVVSIVSQEAVIPIGELTLDGGLSERWLPLEIDLGPWEGTRVTLRIELFRSGRKGRLTEIGYLGSPRLAYRVERSRTGASGDAD